MNAKQINIFLKTLFAVVFVVFVAALAFRTPIGEKAWGHASYGRDIIKNIGLTDEVSFSYAAKAPRDKKTWLFDAFTYSVLKLSGTINSLLWAGMLTLFLTAFILLLVIFKRQQGRYVSITLPSAILAFYLMSPYFTYSPLIFGPFFIACFLYVLERKPVKRNKNLFYSLPFISLLWANMHHSASIGFLLMFVYLIYDFIDTREVEEKRESYDFKLYLMSLAGVGAFTLINPLFYGAPVFFAREIISEPWLDGHVYREPSLYFSLFYTYVAITAAVLLYNLKGADIGRRAEFVKDVLLVVVFMAAAFKSAEYIPYFLVVSIPITAYYTYLIFRWSFAWPRQWTERDLAIIKNYLYAIMIIALATYSYFGFIKEKESGLPAGPVKYIAGTRVPASLFHQKEYGDYLYYYLYPDYKIFMSSRAGYPKEIEEAEEKIVSGGEGFRKHLNKYGINSLLLERGAGVIPKLKGAGYEPAYFDKSYALFVNKYMTDRYFKYINPLSGKKYKKDDYDRALRELEEFTENNPSEPAQFMLGEMYAKRKPPDAISYLEHMTELYPRHYSLYNLLGKLLYGAGDYENAAAVWEESREKDEKTKKLLNRAKDKISR